MSNTIAENLQRLVNARTAISAAITAKGGTVNTGDGFEEFSTDIATIPSGGGGGGDSGKPVRFIDYDGTVVDSYTATEFAELSSMPDNPSHAGLTAQGWNWSLADAKSYVAKYEMLDIGQMYITDDGRTRLYVRLQEGRLSPILKLYLNANSELDIDWGDGKAHSTFTSTTVGYVSEQHDYTSAGDYVVSIGVTFGSFVLRSSSNSISTLFTAGKVNLNSADRGYLNSIKKVEIGDVTIIEGNAFNSCLSLSQIIIPKGVTSIGTSAFSSCASLSQVTIPESVTSIGSYAFSSCASLSQVTIPESVTIIRDDAFQYCYKLSQINIPESVTSIGNQVFADCYKLSQINIPESVTSIGIGAFQNCYSLSQITIPESVTGIGNSAFDHCRSLSQVTIPESVTGIGNSAFYYCSSLSQIIIPKGVTGIRDSTFYGCQSLSQITIPEGVTSIGIGAFQYCNSLSQITIPESVTIIEGNAFINCVSLSQIIIPKGVTSIGTSAFNSCYSSGYVKFESQTPPTLANSGVWGGVPTDCKILVPMGTLDAYKSATNYPNPATYTYEEYDI